MTQPWQLAGNESFWRKVKNFSRAQKKKVLDIVLHSQNGDLSTYFVPNSDLPVRNKNSDNVCKDDSDFLAKVQFAREHSLWHIHAGFYNNPENEYPIYDGYKMSKNKSDIVSQWVLHYSLAEGRVLFVDATPHPINILSIQI